MVFSSFVKQARHRERIQFFQSAYPYMNSQGLISFHKIYSKLWSQRGPRPSRRNRWFFLGIDNGHYGLYYTIYHQESEKNKGRRAENILKQDPRSCGDQLQHHGSFYDSNSNFFILRVNRDIYNHIDYLKSIEYEFLSTLSIFRPKFAAVNQARRFSTVAYRRTKYSDAFVEEDTSRENELDLKEEDDSSFLRNQISLIKAKYNSETESDLNLVYPLYQALKRNNLRLPGVELYNVVLDSIARRSLNNTKEIEDVEMRLTSLLTVYQDLLNSTTKPDKNTYKILLTELFKGAVQVIEIGNQRNCCQALFKETSDKSRDFIKVGTDLFNSISKIHEVDLLRILPLMVSALNFHPHLIDESMIKSLVSIELPQLQNSNYHIGLIGLTAYYSKFEMFSDKEVLYDYIINLYQNYKQSCIQNPDLFDSEYEIYAALIRSLIRNGNMRLATKFLDDILIDYRISLNSLERPSKSEISNLLSVYLSSVMSIDSSIDGLKSCYELLLRFNENSYLPELSISVYNVMINKFINQYYSLEYEKQEDRTNLESICLKQEEYYRFVWKLYDYVAIRKDFQSAEFGKDSLVFGENRSHCRDSLLSLAIDLGDHEKVFQLMKEIMLKNHLIRELLVLKKVSLYLHHGVVSRGFNAQYFELLWNLLENQSIHYQSNPKFLNDFLSDVINYLILERSDYNVKMVMNSEMVSKAFSSFDLQEDNIFGLLVISEFLSDYTYHNEVTDGKQLLRILQYQSSVVLEFENTENHYLPLDEKLIQFKQSLKAGFVNLFNKAENLKIGFTNEIYEACKLYDIHLTSNHEVLELDMGYNLNLSHLLNINYESGVKRFLEYFKKGYKFNESTWNIIINSNFIMNQVDSKIIKLDDLLSRLFELDLSIDVKSDLIKRLLRYEDDKTTIGVTKYLLKINYLLEDSSLMNCLIFSLKESNNRYLRDLIEDNFSALYDMNKNPDWINTFFQFLIDKDNYREVVYLASKHEILKDLSVENPSHLPLLCKVLNASLKLGDYEQFNDLFKSHFDGLDLLNKSLTESKELAVIVINYYTLMGSYDLVLDKFRELGTESPEVRAALAFTKYLKSLTNTELSMDYGEMKSLSEQSLILISNNFEEINEFYENNRAYVKYNREKLTNLSLSNLIKSGYTLNKSTQSKEKKDEINRNLVKKFHSLLKALKLCQLKLLSTDSLVLIIKFLSISNSDGVLNIILNKVIHKNQFSELLQFYFMEVWMKTSNDQIKVLETLRSAFVFLNDPSNVERIDDFCRANAVNLKVKDMGDEVFN
ncbi:uncharacterized protein PRCAT00003432001 [Priceomyces carsonii]|uniref:uncharacterized protein n=1 Tax=Priceomyces carsonii TaxID=28549 RepID=UPI002ED8C5D2|nr:unnamed protein product [Priceomyces carsonii]